MTIALDQAIHVGKSTIVAMVNRSIMCQSMCTVSFQAAKRPVAILVKHDEVTLAFDLDGSPIAMEKVEELFSTALAAFERMTSGPYRTISNNAVCPAVRMLEMDTDIRS